MSIKDYCNIPVKIKVFNLIDLSQVLKWLVRNIDPGKYYLGAYDYENKIKYVYFSDHKDAMCFSLVWE